MYKYLEYLDNFGYAPYYKFVEKMLHKPTTLRQFKKDLNAIIVYFSCGGSSIKGVFTPYSAQLYKVKYVNGDELTELINEFDREWQHVVATHTEHKSDYAVDLTYFLVNQAISGKNP